MRSKRIYLPPSDLPVAVVRRAVDAYMCPWCGRGPFVVLARHVSNAHGIDPYSLRERAGLTFGASICAPEHSERCAARAQPGHLTPGCNGLPHGRSTAGETARAAAFARVRAAAYTPAATAKRRASLRRVWTERTPESRALILAATQSPEASSKRAATLGRAVHQAHGTQSRYERGCRCPECADGPTARNRQQRALRKARVARLGCPPDRHGTATGYTYWGCRCDGCKAAGRTLNQAARRRAKAKRAAP